MIKYQHFLTDFDKKLAEYFQRDTSYICCHAGCSSCCEKGDYPISQLELEYIMQGFIQLDNETKIKIQENIKKLEKGCKCPFLVHKKCSIYQYRPIICRVYGLAYLCKNNIVKIPYCVHEGKNYASIYKFDNEISIAPIAENLDTPNVLKDFDYGEIRNLYDWIKCS